MHRTLLTLGLCSLAAATSGCSTWKKSTREQPTKEPWTITKLWKKEYQQPQSMAVIWAPDVLAMPGSTPTRGFGGRIYFYNQLSQAVPVEGDLIVHGYLKQNPRSDVSEQISADKTFAFTAEQLTSHFSPSEIGASYSIWIPWDAADGLRTEVTLIPTFKGKDGSIVQGTPSKVNLPGKAPAGVEDQPRSLMQTIAYSRTTTPTHPGPAVSEPSPVMRTTTIHVPANASFGRQPRPASLTLGQPKLPMQPQQSFAPNQGYINGSGVTVGGGASGTALPTNSQQPTSLPTAGQATGQATEQGSLSPARSGANQGSQPARSGELQVPKQLQLQLPTLTPGQLPPPITFPLPTTA